MRMIDFRAWDKKESEILDVMDIDFSGNKVGVCNVPKRLFKDGRLHTIHSIERNWNEVELMQYTGLKDKNGMEIYEGDILEVEKNEDGTYKGTINGKTFFDRFQGYSSKIKVEGMHDIDTLRYWNNRVRIIGNIYENPELLEEI